MKRFVAFLDILGFKNMVNNREHDELITVMNQFKSAISTSNGLATSLDGERIPLVQYVTFSDSIVLYTDGDSSSEFFRIVHVVKLLLAYSLGGSTPLRGSIAHGDFYADIQNNIFVGKALVTAYENEGKQQWAGAYICDQAVSFIKNQYPQTIDTLKEKAYLYEYKIPFKKIVDNEPKLAVNWANSPLTQGLSLETTLQIGYPFFATEIDKKCKEIEQNQGLSQEEKSNIRLGIDKDSVPCDILEKWENTYNFFNIAKTEGNCCIKHVTR